MLLQILLNGLITGLVFGLIALGFSLVYSSVKFFDIGFGAIYTASVYFYLFWLSIIRSPLEQSSGAAIAIAVLLSLISMGAIYLILEKVVYLPLLKKSAPPLVLFLSSLGIYIIVVNLIALFFGSETRILQGGMESTWSIGNTTLTRMQIIQSVVSVLLILAVFLLLNKSSLGRNIRALSDNPVLLSTIGINIESIRIGVFVLGGLLATAASLLRGFDVGIDPYVGLSAVLTAAVAVIIGGVGYHFGSVISAVMLGIAQSIAIYTLSVQWRDSATFVVLMLVLLARREGLLARQLRVEEA